jgi:preprotein translocase subunit SecE
MAQSTKGAQRPSVFARLGNYFRNVRAELRRVVWPTRQEVINSSVIVIVTLVFFVLFTLVVDSISSFLLIDVLAAIGR